MESIGLKEWSLVCEALGRGEQTIILRKGGIAEGRDAFSFRHGEFFLFPTFFHEQVASVRTRTADLPESPEVIRLDYYAKVEQCTYITSLEQALSLMPLHILSEEVVRERFNYKAAGINVAFVRVFALAEPWLLPTDKRYAGCRSWIDLPRPAPGLPLQPVLDDAAHATQRAIFETMVDGASVVAQGR